MNTICFIQITWYTWQTKSIKTHAKCSKPFAVTQATHGSHCAIATTTFQKPSDDDIWHNGSCCQNSIAPYNNWLHIITNEAKKPIKYLWFFAPKIKQNKYFE